MQFDHQRLHMDRPGIELGLSQLLPQSKRKHAIYKHGNFNPCLGLYAAGPRKL